ncbi:MAG TPA: glycosyltransferase family 4 protein [Pyrinomonadaceae bacterium]
MKQAPARTLYICYFGLREPLVQTQVLPYLRELIAGGIEVYLLTFEPQLSERWTGDELESARAQLAAEGIRWFQLAYHKRPSLPATLYDISAGARLAARLVRREKIDVIHARSHVAAMMGARAKRRSGAQLIFDIRGFMPEEYVDAGVWPAGGYLYRLAKAGERKLLRAADGFVVLTERARRILFPESETGAKPARPVEVIPCCVDTKRFRAADALSREEVQESLNVSGRRVFVYVGALGGWYLTEEMADFLSIAHQQDESAFSLILTQSEPLMIAGQLRQRGVHEQDYLITRAAPAEIPRYLKAADVGLSFIKPCYSKLSSSPTKIAEYLASGLPVICNGGIGDLDEQIATDRVGIIIREFNHGAYGQALTALEELRQDERLAERCMESARRRFDLEQVGGERYRRLYRNLLRPRGQEPSEDLSKVMREP